MRKTPLLIGWPFLFGWTAACGTHKASPISPRPPQQIVSVQATVRNVFSPTSAAFTASDCAGANLQVQIFDAASFILAPAVATPLATCPVSATDGTFSCGNIDLAQDQSALVGLYDDVDNATSDCVATSATILVPCAVSDFADATNALCGSGHALDDKIISEKETTGAFVVPMPIFQQLDSDSQSITAPAGEVFEPLSASGATLNLVLDQNQQPFAAALPYLPANCSSKWECRTLFVAPPATSGDLPTLDPDLNLTSALGMWIGQIEQLTGTQPGIVPGDINALLKNEQQFSAVDCSGAATPQCFTQWPSKPIHKDERGKGTTAVTVINVIFDVPAVAGVCPLNTALAGAKPTPIAPSILACPSR